jgi:hypothetical protein
MCVVIASHNVIYKTDIDKIDTHILTEKQEISKEAASINQYCV